MVKEITDTESLEAFIKDNKVVIIDFYADWCGPCKVIKPKFEAFSAEYEGIAFAKVNVDDAYDVAELCGINAAPTFQVFKDGEKAEELKGANEGKLKELIEKHKA